MTIFSYYTTKLGVQPFDPDAQAIFDRMPNALLEGEKTVINEWVVASKSSGNFSKYDYFYGFFLSDRDNALTDWITGKTATAFNSPSHTANQGFSFNGSTQYINTNIDLLNESNNYVTNSAEIGMYCYENRSTATNAMATGSFSSSLNRYTALFQNSASSSIAFTINGDQSPAQVNVLRFFQNLTRYTINRESVGIINLYVNGSKFTATESSVIPSTLNPYIACRNFNGSPNLFIEADFSYWYSSGGNFDQSALNTELQILENNLIT